MKINANYLNLKQSYLFAHIAKKVAEFSAANPDAKIIKMVGGGGHTDYSHIRMLDFSIRLCKMAFLGFLFFLF